MPVVAANRVKVLPLMTRRSVERLSRIWTVLSVGLEVSTMSIWCWESCFWKFQLFAESIHEVRVA